MCSWTCHRMPKRAFSHACRSALVLFSRSEDNERRISLFTCLHAGKKQDCSKCWQLQSRFRGAHSFAYGAHCFILIVETLVVNVSTSHSECKRELDSVQEGWVIEVTAEDRVEVLEDDRFCDAEYRLRSLFDKICVFVVSFKRCKFFPSGYCGIYRG